MCWDMFHFSVLPFCARDIEKGFSSNMPFTDSHINMLHPYMLCYSVLVDETSTNISLTIIRDRGTFGDVSVFFYAQSIVEGTNLGLDYIISPEVRPFNFPVCRFSYMCPCWFVLCFLELLGL